ncbi:GATA zinc finger domain-containing protein [Mycena venus]|uniref:GATA zinc finger domain-containing protein n=1 Tax=Mycena venus TaxID=2733690 RepID=A0A8H6YKJ7_9AGAR|nr:GATA zinc finger domain-containing protein [Mycena venus]
MQTARIYLHIQQPLQFQLPFLSENTENSMSDRTNRYYRPSSGSSNVPTSNYSSLINAVPMNGQPSSSGYYGGNQMYPQTSANQGHPPSQAYQQGYGAQPAYGYGAAGPQGPTTPYASGSGTQYPNTTAHYPGSQQQPYSSTASYNTSQYGNNYAGFTAAPGPYPGYSLPAADPGTSIKQCYNCGKMSTPLWRRDPYTQRTLCNACGLYQQQRNEPRPQALIDADNDEDEDQQPITANGPQCSHCGTYKTSVWRRNKDGEQVCNACGVYYRVNGRERPLTMKQSKVKPRAKHTH